MQKIKFKIRLLRSFHSLIKIKMDSRFHGNDKKRGIVYFNISLNNKTFISDIFFKVESLVINISAFASKEVAI